MRKLHTRALSLIILSCIAVTAQTAHGEQIAGDHEAISPEFNHGLAGPFIIQALRYNPAISAAEKRFEAAKASEGFAGALPNPSIQVTHFVESVQTRVGPQRNAFSIQQPLPVFGKRLSKRETAQAKAEALWNAFAEQQYSLAREVAALVFEVAYLEKAIASQSEGLALLRRLETVAEERVKAGANLDELLELQIEIGLIENQLSQMVATHAATLAELSASLGSSATAPSIPIEWEPPSPILASPDRWLEAIEAQAPQLAMLRALQQSEEARARLASFARRPDITIGANYLQIGDAINPTTPGSGKDAWSVMVGLSLPIWGKANTALELQASLQSEAIAAELESTSLKLRAEGSANIAKLQGAFERIDRFESYLLPLARQSQEIAETRYQSGKLPLSNLIERERALLTLNTEYWRAAADAWKLKWKLATLSAGLWLE